MPPQIRQGPRVFLCIAQGDCAANDLMRRPLWRLLRCPLLPVILFNLLPAPFKKK
jgi:hypothetical protein